LELPGPYSFHVGINHSLYFIRTQLVSWRLQKLVLLSLPHCLRLKKIEHLGATAAIDIGDFLYIAALISLAYISSSNKHPENI